ncbi:predicted protein [Histoplasma capsulatum var. duboisii H88]|uniref:Predicted protein n=2 Tax=Ajellomyces capsulatus TaxID=5037 RepID=F0U4Y8_AJEC8|nr:predicted protein [Histoplasma capsulatum H143]EGC42031.1 predicted protein [Histoplasma capsulatum var. duboisii H88]
MLPFLVVALDDEAGQVRADSWVPRQPDCELMHGPICGENLATPRVLGCTKSKEASNPTQSRELNQQRKPSDNSGATPSEEISCAKTLAIEHHYAQNVQHSVQLEMTINKQTDLQVYLSLGPVTTIDGYMGRDGSASKSMQVPENV